MSELVKAIKKLNQITGLDFKVSHHFSKFCDVAIYSKKRQLFFTFKFSQERKPSYQFQSECFFYQENNFLLKKTVNKGKPFSVEDIILEFKEYLLNI
ncbi:hypothetical protein [Pasteurella multocida]|uniref:hypothetical protein n=1 Tax=Pasteurella multocida TaxID=747 RepID=UPI00147BC7E8|nr:hypothetical protein [Pasteurella multocida]NNH97748.1 hypothetical protein [Pasteurella multocida]NNI42909.1 hypothetical protein [Pasteurella multocida]